MARQYQNLQRSALPTGARVSAATIHNGYGRRHNDTRDVTVELKRFTITLPQVAPDYLSIGCLVKKRYAWHGYQTTAGSEATPQSLTLAIDAGGVETGALTLNFDSHRGLVAENLHLDEIASLRAAGRKLCECARFRFNARGQARQILAWLFSAAYCYGRHISNSSDILIEANARHASFYQRALGFTVLGTKKICPSLNTPLILLRGNIGWMADQIERTRHYSPTTEHPHPLYKLFPSPEREREIVRRLRGETSD